MKRPILHTLLPNEGTVFCRVCKVAGSALLTYCPGRPLNYETRQALQIGQIKDLCAYRWQLGIQTRLDPDPHDYLNDTQHFFAHPRH